MKSLIVLAIGTPVHIADDIKATVTTISIHDDNYVTYEVVWWDGRTRNTAWVEEFEIAKLEHSQSTLIGFKQTVNRHPQTL